MDHEDLPKKLNPMVIGETLETLSVAELAQRLIALDSEKLRVQAEITKKQQSRTAADAFFSNKS